MTTRLFFATLVSFCRVPLGYSIAAADASLLNPKVSAKSLAEQQLDPLWSVGD